MREVYKLGDIFRQNGVNTAIDISARKLADQLKGLDKRKIPYVLTVGPEELKSQKFNVRNTETREEKTGNIDEIVNFLKKVGP